ncbi:MAG: hypothetical protein RSA21_00060 [Akkermansia sp.]
MSIFYNQTRQKQSASLYLYAKDELALTLNGKKRKITRSDFEIAMLQTGLENKIITNIFAKLIKVADKWVDWIHLSFLPEEMKAQYQTILQAKIEKIQ